MNDLGNDDAPPLESAGIAADARETREHESQPQGQPEPTLADAARSCQRTEASRPGRYGAAYPCGPAGQGLAARVEWTPGLKLFWAVFGIPTCLIFSWGMWFRLTRATPRLNDFVQEWTSARNYFTGRPIYWSLHDSLQAHFGRSIQVILDINAHPPASVLLVLPFGKLNYLQANLAWNILSLVLLIPTLWLIMRQRGLNLTAWMLLPVGIFVLTSNSLAQQVNQGQLNLVLLFLLVGAWAAQRASRDSMAGLLIGLAAAIKLYPAFFALYFVAQRRWHGVAGVAVGFLLLNGLTAAVLGWQAHVDYFLHVVPQVGQFRDFWSNASITGYFSKLFDGSSGHVVPLLYSPLLAKVCTAAGSLTVVAVTGWRCRQAESDADRDLAFGLCIIAMLLVSPITWDHYFILLLLPMLAMWRWLPKTWSNRVALVIMTFLLCTIYPKFVWDLTIPGDGELVFEAGKTASIALPRHTLTVLSYQFYSLLALFVFAATREPAPGRPHESAVRHAFPAPDDRSAGLVN